MMELNEVKNYEDAVSYIMMIPRFSGKNTKDITDDFYIFLGEPGKQATIVHVAGTNGKGSVCAYLKSICMELGKRVGTFTSPHLVDIRERITVDEKDIDQQNFYEAFAEVRENLLAFRNQSPKTKEYHPSFFEMLFFIAMVYFEKEQPDIILLETGLGGRLDATNAVTRKDICIITEIGYDHMEYLGNTLASIASEKAGILRENVPAIYVKKRQEISDIMERKAKELSLSLEAVSNEDAALISIHDKHIDFSYKSRYYEYIRLTLHTKALYQMENATLALRAAEMIFSKEQLSVEQMQQGVSHMHWEGRMEEVLPNVIVDGAHNEDGIDAFLESVSKDGCKGERSLLFSAVSDKQVDAIADMITNAGLFAHIYVAQMENERGLSTEKLASLYAGCRQLQVCSSISEAMNILMRTRTKEDTVYIVGSLYLAGQIKKSIKELGYDKF